MFYKRNRENKLKERLFTKTRAEEKNFKHIFLDSCVSVLSWYIAICKQLTDYSIILLEGKKMSAGSAKNTQLNTFKM